MQSTLETLKEQIHSIIPYGAKASFVWDVHLRIGVLLEQTAHMALGLLEVKFEDKESMQSWHSHSPSLMFAFLKDSLGKIATSSQLIQEALAFRKEQKEFIAKFDRTVSIASRYPVSGSDDFSKQLSSLLKIKQGNFSPAIFEKISKRFSEDNRQVLFEGLSISLNILESLFPEITLPEITVSYHFMMDKAFYEPAFPNLSREANSSVVPSLKKTLKEIEWRRMVPQARQLAPLHEGDFSLAQRIGTIYSVLRDLAMIVELSHDLLMMAEDPSICLTMGQTALRLESVTLELCCLIWLSHLPCSSNTNPRMHYLFDQKENPTRYSHRLGEFAETLHKELGKTDITFDNSLINKTLERARYLTPYLKTLYRYTISAQDEEIESKVGQQIDQLHSLSGLWNGLIESKLQPQELNKLDRKLGIQDPTERQLELACYIQNIMIQQYKEPLKSTLEVVNHWMALYKQNI